jgi:glucose/arabinose dehydrogenase
VSSDLYVVEQSGRVILVRGGVRRAVPFLDLRTLVLFSGEQGLLSVAFPPDHVTTRRFYVFFVNKAGNVQLDEYRRSTADGRIADPATRRVLLVVPHPDAGNHNGGRLQFDANGLLYLSIGDGGATPTNAPNRRLLLGKLLRIDPKPAAGKPYGIPAGNPYVASTTFRKEIFAYGLRNPWRWSLEGNNLAIGDVGQNIQEEIDLATVTAARGANFGWPKYEGTLVHDGSAPEPDKARFPARVYSHAGGGCAVVGGHVVNAPDLPSLRGRYVYGDFCTGQIRSFVPDVAHNKATGDAATGLTIPGLTSFGKDTSGRLYATDGSKVYRIAP